MMNRICRAAALLLSLLLLFSSTSLAAKEEYTVREITTEVLQEIPETIQQVLDLAYQEWIDTDAKNLKKKNKYTTWRNQGEFSWCGGFVTYCMLQLGIPQEEKNHIKDGDVEGLVHVKEAGVGKMYTGYAKMNRITLVPQKGFIAVFGTSKAFKGSGSTAYYHVGLVYDVEKLSDGKYRLTTIEGAVTSPGDETHRKAGYTVRMYVRDYDYQAALEKKTKSKDLLLVPEEERTQEESALFSYHYSYDNKNEYITVFLMPWIPEETQNTTEE